MRVLTAAAFVLLTLVSSNSHASSNDFKVAITQQINKVNSSDKSKVDSLIEVVTVSQMPTMLSLKSVGTPRRVEFLRVEEATNYKSTCLRTGKPCKQRFVAFLDANAACRLDGQYQLRFEVNCASGMPRGKCKPVSVHFVPITLKSENFCRSKNIKIDKVD